MKINALAALGLNSEVIDRMTRRLHVEDMPELAKLVSITRSVSGDRRMFNDQRIRQRVSQVPLDTIIDFARHYAEFADAPTTVAETLENYQRISPVGRLHLEKIEMYPVGVERGELVFTVPMAPGETVTLSHKEWSTSKSEFEDIVQDYFESYSERGVTEKTDTSTSLENEATHTNVLNFGASVSGSYAGVTISTTLGLTNTKNEKTSSKRSAQAVRELTEKASSRARQEHKVSVRIETQTGTSDQSAKTITNPGPDTRRIDYYRMMRKWKTNLYRYGLRQTYDIAIPLPGLRLWTHHKRIIEIEQKLNTPFEFTLDPATITDGTRKKLESQYEVLLEPAPPEGRTLYDTWAAPELGSNDAKFTRYAEKVVDVPPGYVINTQAGDKTVMFSFAWWPDKTPTIEMLETSPKVITQQGAGKQYAGYWDLKELRERDGQQRLSFFYSGLSSGTLKVAMRCRLTGTARNEWQRRVWAAAKAAAEVKHGQELAQLQAERDRLYRILNGKDTLRLRRIEREELVRLTMQWLLGPGYPVQTTAAVDKLIDKLEMNEAIANQYVAASQQLSPITSAEWYAAVLQGELVKFIQTAVEWENILYFLYPYFWGSSKANSERMLFEHPDPEHERFIRAGYARIVLPIRPGFETDFTALMEKGSLDDHSEHPYVSITEEIQNFAHTNYTGVPPANPELNARPLLYPVQRQTWDIIQTVCADIDEYKRTNGQLPASLNDLPGGTPNDAWGNPLHYVVPGEGADYDVYSLGADNNADTVRGLETVDADISTTAEASLIATWFDYTPSSGIDIEVDTETKDIA